MATPVLHFRHRQAWRSDGEQQFKGEVFYDHGAHCTMAGSIEQLHQSDPILFFQQKVPSRVCGDTEEPKMLRRCAL